HGRPTDREIADEPSGDDRLAIRLDGDPEQLEISGAVRAADLNIWSDRHLAEVLGRTVAELRDEAVAFVGAWHVAPAQVHAIDAAADEHGRPRRIDPDVGGLRLFE